MKLFAFLLIIGALPPAFAEDPARVPWTLDESYSGSHQASFNKLRHSVPVLMRQTMIDLAVRTGLDFEEGWRFPITIRFDDQAPYGVENILAYVQMMQNTKGEIRQELVINLKAYDNESFNFAKVFAHELVHAMLNDSMGVASTKVPVWFHEGLAVYGAMQGEQVMESYVRENENANGSGLLNGLEGAHGGLDYLEDYLLFKYVREKRGINSLKNLVREVIQRGGDVPGAVRYTFSEDWNQFQANARQFSEEEINRVDRSLRGEQSTRPY